MCLEFTDTNQYTKPCVSLKPVAIGEFQNTTSAASQLNAQLIFALSAADFLSLLIDIRFEGRGLIYLSYHDEL